MILAVATADAFDLLGCLTVLSATRAFATVRRPDSERCWPKNLSPVHFFWLIHFHLPRATYAAAVILKCYLCTMCSM